MKTIIITAVASLFVLSHIDAQDTIWKTSGDSILSKVLEITPTSIKYKRFDNQNGPTYSIMQSEVSMVQYQNGTLDTFGEKSLTNAESIDPVTPGDLYTQGGRHAFNYYKGYKPASTGTLVTSLLSPVVGLIPAIACASTRPQKKTPIILKKVSKIRKITQEAMPMRPGRSSAGTFGEIGGLDWV
jgi:hypothetical protein